MKARTANEYSDFLSLDRTKSRLGQLTYYNVPLSLHGHTLVLFTPLPCPNSHCIESPRVLLSLLISLERLRHRGLRESQT
jgi:hypothetical protein